MIHKPTHKASSDSQINNEPKAASNLPTVKLNAGGTPIEGDAAGTFTITLDNAAPEGGLTVNYTLAGTATLTADYTVTAGSNVTAVTDSSFTIAAGQTAAVLNINATADSVSDPNETVILKLNAGTGYRLGQWDVTTFSPKVDYATGSTPFSVISGDFNNDDKLDLAVANASSSTVSVLLRNAANTGFDAKVDYATGSTPTSVSTGDFNNDGKLDLAVANGISNTVSVLLRNAANTGFDAKVDYATGSIPTSVSTGDFNNDGKLDLAVVNKNSNTVSVLLRNAANTGFAAKVDYAVGTNPFIGNVGDFNNDGKLDLVVANQKSNTVSVLLRNAANTGFAAKIDVATGLYPTSVSTGDFNNDGKLDLAVANQSSNTVSILLRNAKNTGFDAKVDYATGSAPYFVNAGDFNSDGKLDLAVANNKSNTVSVLLRNAANTGFDAKVDYATGSAPYSVNAGDFNNDGKLDLTVVNQSSNTVSALLNNSTPTASLAIADAIVPETLVAPSFLVGGRVVTVVGNRIGYGYSVTVQTDGKILLSGSGDISKSGYLDDPDFALVRYNGNGSLDTSFNELGIVITTSGYIDSASSVIVQVDGKILLGGPSHGQVTSSFFLVRYNADGSLDTNFDSDGKVYTKTSSYWNEGESLAIQADGKILLGGFSDDNFALLRYNSDGSLDTSFDGDGIVTTVGGFDEEGQSVTVQNDGKILLAGSSDGDFALLRYNSNGTLDTSFDSDGKVTTNFGGSDSGESLVLQADGKILLGGYAASDYFALVRYNTDGSLDTSFDSDGIVTTDVGGGSSSNKAYSVALQADGKILLGGTTTQKIIDGVYTYHYTSDFALVRYNTDGTLDTSFDGDGIVITDLDLGGDSDQGRSVTVQADGKILLGGSSNGNFALIRYNPDGSIDNTFNTLNTLNANPTFTENGAAVVLDNSVEIYDVELANQGHYNGTSITLMRHEGANSQDIFTGSGNLSFSGNDAVLSAVTIGTVSNSNGMLTINFNSNATQTRVNETLSSLAYSNSSDTPDPSVKIDWTFTYGNTNAALSTTGSTDVTIININEIFGTAKNNTLTGTAAADQIYGLDGNDKLNGLGGDDTLEGGNGNDKLTGGLGKDKLIGGAGNDIYIVDSDDMVIETSTLSTEIDSVTSSFNYTLGDNLEKLTLTGKSALNGTGNELNNTLIGNAGNNTLNGNNGNDILIGGLGQDTLIGGSGLDIFKFNSLAEIGADENKCDIIDYFNNSFEGDKIDLSAIDADTTVAGNNTFLPLGEVDSFSHFSGVFTKPGELFYAGWEDILYGNNDADSKADFAIKFTGLSQLENENLIL